ncbi:MAG: ester cyclase [Roseobacter sp.]|jgi:steroid delta-isomerase-like uncharacterized protein|nr:ester cyclase [Roseobacter sp.]
MSVMASVQRYFDGWNAGDVDAILASLADTGTYEDPGTGQPISGDAFRGYIQGIWAAFPDLRFEITSAAPTGDQTAAAEWVMLGTNTGSMNGLPPSGKEIRVEGSDFFVLDGDRIASVRGYFDGGAIPRQLGLDIIVQPSAIGPFRFGVSTMVRTGKTQEPAAFSITYLEANDADEVQIVREGSRKSMIDMLSMEGFIGATTSTIGTRMVTISAWDSPDAPRKMMSEGAHAEEQRKMLSGPVAQHGFTSVWTKERVNPFFLRCKACGKMSRGANDGRECECGEALHGPVPYW